MGVYCPAFVCSRFLICKHLVQAVQPVVFLQVKRNRTLPFLEHPTFICETQHLTTSTTQIPSKHKDHQVADIDAEDSDNGNEDEGEDNMVDDRNGR